LIEADGARALKSIRRPKKDLLGSGNHAQFAFGGIDFAGILRALGRGLN